MSIVNFNEPEPLVNEADADKVRTLINGQPDGDQLAKMLGLN